MQDIHLHIMGGLGNQLYQYAAARYLQEKYGFAHLMIDTSGYDNYKIRNLEIDSLIRPSSKPIFFKDISITNLLMREAYHTYQRIYREIFKKHPKPTQLTIGSTVLLYSTIEFADPKLSNCDHLKMYGYFVSSMVAQKMKATLMKEIVSPKAAISETYKEYKDMLRSKYSIAVSVRCGDDYARNGWPVCSKEFYLEGLSHINEIINESEYQIMVFADDINRIQREHWFDEISNITYINGISVCESFDLLRRCNSYVCSNSSFSWWGAFLSRSDNPVVISPNRVFGGAQHKLYDACTYYQEQILCDYLTGECI